MRLCMILFICILLNFLHENTYTYYVFQLSAKERNSPSRNPALDLGFHAFNFLTLKSLRGFVFQ
jgi:hypothetical protein